MPILSIDSGILLSAISVIVTIFLFLFKTMSSKSEKAIIYGETVKKNDEAVKLISTQLDYVLKKLNQNDVDIISIKKDLEYFKIQDVAGQKEFDRLRERIEKSSNR